MYHCERKSVMCGYAGSCEITDLTKMEGEATANNRKGKLIFFYEWVLSGSWQGNYLEVCFLLHFQTVCYKLVLWTSSSILTQQ